MATKCIYLDHIPIHSFILIAWPVFRGMNSDLGGEAVESLPASVGEIDQFNNGGVGIFAGKSSGR